MKFVPEKFWALHMAYISNLELKSEKFQSLFDLELKIIILINVLRKILVSDLIGIYKTFPALFVQNSGFLFFEWTWKNFDYCLLWITEKKVSNSFQLGIRDFYAWMDLQNCRLLSSLGLRKNTNSPLYVSLYWDSLQSPPLLLTYPKWRSWNE